MNNHDKCSLSKSRKSVQKYYDEVGWKKCLETTVDSAKNVDFRINTLNYVFQGFPREGNILLDVGCGANPRNSLSENYKKHICLDFSMQGLKIARNKLFINGFYFCGDIISLPFSNNSFDAIICDHVLYHFLIDEQIKVIDELYRVLAYGGIIYISYTKGDEWLLSIYKRRVKSVLRKTPFYFLYRLLKTSNLRKQKDIEALSSIHKEIQKAGAPIFNSLSLKWWSEHLNKKGYQYSFKGIGLLPTKTTRMMPRYLAIFLTHIFGILSKYFNSLMFPLAQYYYIIISKPKH